MQQAYMEAIFQVILPCFEALLKCGRLIGVPGYGPKWFRDDVKRQDSGEAETQGYEVFHCNEDRINVAVVSSRKYVSYWSIRR